MENITQNTSLSPFSVLFMHSISLVIRNFFKLIITVFFTSLLSSLIIVISLLPVTIFVFFVLQSSGQSEIAFSLFLLAVSLLFLIFAFFYQIAFKFKALLLVLGQNKHVFDSVGQAFIGSTGLTFANIITFAILIGIATVLFIVTIMFLSISKFMILFVWPIIVFIFLLSIALFLIPYICVMESKSGFSAVRELYLLTKNNVLRVIGRILMFYFILTAIGLVLRYLMGSPLQTFASFFSNESRIQMFLIQDFRTLLTVFLVFAVAFLKISFLFNLYTELRSVNPLSNSKLPFHYRFPVYITSFVGITLMYLFVILITTLSFYLLKPRAIYNQIKDTNKTTIEDSKLFRL